MTTENQAPEGGPAADQKAILQECSGFAYEFAHDCRVVPLVYALNALDTQPAQSPAEGDAPKVPDYVLACVHAYGDARADDDGTSAQHLRHAIEEMRRWASTLAAPNVQPKGTEPSATAGAADRHFYEAGYAAGKLAAQAPAPEYRNAP